MMLFRNLFITAAVSFSIAGNLFAAASPMGPLWHYVMLADGSSSLVSADAAEPTPAASPISVLAEPTPVVETPVAQVSPEVASPSPESETPKNVVELGYDAGDFTNSMTPDITPTSLPVLTNSAGINFSPRSASVTLAFCTGLLYLVL